MTPQKTDWRKLAEQASQELDSKKLMALVEELNVVLESTPGIYQRPHVQ
jgi:hypothetical protein